MRIVLALNMSELVGINLSSFLISVSATLISVIEIMVRQIWTILMWKIGKNASF